MKLPLRSLGLCLVAAVILGALFQVVVRRGGDPEEDASGDILKAEDVASRPRSTGGPTSNLMGSTGRLGDVGHPKAGSVAGSNSRASAGTTAHRSEPSIWRDKSRVGAGHGVVQAPPGGGGFDARQRAIRSMPFNMDAATTKELVDWVSDGRQIPKGLSQAEWRGLWNDVTERLVRDQVVGIGDQLQEVYVHPETDAVIKDYAVQMAGLYLDEALNPIDPPAEPISSSDVEAAEEVLEAALVDAELSSSGTALIAKHVLDESRIDPSVSRAALRLASTPPSKTSQGNRATAIAVLAERGRPEARTIAMEMLADRRTSPIVKLASIAALGTVGSRSDIEWAESEVGHDLRFQQAFRSATLSQQTQGK